MTSYRSVAKILQLVWMLAVLGTPSTSFAQPPGKVDLEAAELQALHPIGTPVFAGDSSEIGQVSDVSIGADGRVAKIRVRMAAPLGLGERIVEILAPAFTIQRHFVVLELTSEEVDKFLPVVARPSEASSEDPPQDK